jgi:hypothetical protein
VAPLALAGPPEPKHVQRKRAANDRHPPLEVDTKEGEMLHQKVHERPPDRARGSPPINIFFIFFEKNLLRRIAPLDQNSIEATSIGGLRYWLVFISVAGFEMSRGRILIGTELVAAY